MIISQAGWYDEDMEFIAYTDDELIEYLEDNDMLNDMVTEYICDNFDMEDFISEKMYDREYMNREDMIQDFKEHEIKMGEDFDNGGTWYCWYEEGTELKEDD